MNAWKSVRREVQYTIVRLALWIVGAMPRRMCVGLFARIGALAYRLLGRERRAVLRHLELAYPGTGAAELEVLARRSFVDLGRNAADIARVLYGDPREFLERCDVEGVEHFEAARAAGRGAIGVTGHIGAWELLAGWFAFNFGVVHVIARPLKDRRYERLLSQLRSRLDLAVVHEGDSMRPFIRALRAGGRAGIVIDQNRVAKGTWVPLFGRPAFVAGGVIELARLSRAVLLPMAIQRVGDRHLVRIHAPVGDGSDPEAELTACVAVLESWIREHPSQWVWMYDRWSGPRQATPEGAATGREVSGAEGIRSREG